MVNEGKEEDTPCKTHRTSLSKLCERMVENTKLGAKQGACVMTVLDEYVEGGSLEVTMQN